MIIGVTGSYGAGKDTVAEVLIEKGFVHISFSDLIREELRRQGIPITRENLITTANQLREHYGADYWAQQVIQMIQKENNYVITSIRNSAEVHKLQEQPNFTLINVTAPEDVRLERLRARNREQDPTTIEELREKETREKSEKSTDQQLHKVAEMATITIVNDATVEELRQKVDWFLHQQGRA